MHRMLGFALVILTAVLPRLAAASTWQIDPAHSSAQFAVRHLMVSTVRGTLGKVTGTATLNEADVAKSSVEATVDPSGVDTREPKRDEHLKGPDFLDVAKYPTITFKSKRVQKIGDTKYRVVGDLTLHGVTKEVTLDADGTPTPFKDPMGKQRIGGAVTTKLSRQEFGIQWNKSLDGGGVVVGDQVDVTIDIELTRTD